MNIKVQKQTTETIEVSVPTTETIEVAVPFFRRTVDKLSWVALLSPEKYISITLSYSGSFSAILTGHPTESATGHNTIHGALFSADFIDIPQHEWLAKYNSVMYELLDCIKNIKNVQP